MFTHRLPTLFWLCGLALPGFVACSDDAGPEGVPRGKSSFGGSYSGPVTGPGSDASLPPPGDAAVDGPTAPKLDCKPGSWDCYCEPLSTQACTCDSGASGSETCRPSGAGFGPCVCDVQPNAKLGSACASDADCGADLTCVTPSSAKIEKQGPAGGLCTRPCEDDATVCGKLKPNAKCIGFPDQGSKTRYCLEACEFGDPGGNKAGKCHGRSDMGCAPIVVPGLGEVARVCLPTCNSDQDCGGSLSCDPGTGLCAAAAPTGDPVGKACTEGSATCRGFCEKLDLPVSGSTTTLCAERCTAGAIADGKTVCGWNKSLATKADAACIYYPGAVTSPGYGDRGACGQLCDCNTHCNKDLICQPLPQGLDLFFKRAGQCTAPYKVDGSVAQGITACPDGG